MVDPMTIPSELREDLLREMGPDEQMRWFAQPRPGPFMLGSLGLAIFGIPWTAFALVWTAGAAGFKVPDLENPDWTLLFALWGLPFIGIGLGMLSSPLRALRRARRIAYVITNRRAIIMEGGRRRLIRSIGPESFGDLVRRERSGGRGDIVFSGSVQPLSPDHGLRAHAAEVAGESGERARKALTLMRAVQRSSGKHGKADEIAFVDIPNPRQVEELLRSMEREKRW